jgi:hypothetical protein
MFQLRRTHCEPSTVWASSSGKPSIGRPSAFITAWPFTSASFFTVGQFFGGGFAGRMAQRRFSYEANDTRIPHQEGRSCTAALTPKFRRSPNFRGIASPQSLCGSRSILSIPLIHRNFPFNAERVGSWPASCDVRQGASLLVTAISKDMSLDRVLAANQSPR